MYIYHAQQLNGTDLVLFPRFSPPSHCKGRRIWAIFPRGLDEASPSLKKIDLCCPKPLSTLISPFSHVRLTWHVSVAPDRRRMVRQRSSPRACAHTAVALTGPSALAVSVAPHHKRRVRGEAFMHTNWSKRAIVDVVQLLVSFSCTAIICHLQMYDTCCNIRLKVTRSPARLSC